MTQPNYTNSMMDAVCEALEEWDLSDWQIDNLAADLPGEYRAHMHGLGQVDYAPRRPVSLATEGV